jgi:FkbM family methyltransferase
MSFISYAQNYEDVMLWRALKHIDKGTYIDIGAWSPDVDSVTRAFYEKEWNGINVEPNNKYYLEYLTKRKRDVNLNLAISDKEAESDFFIVSNPGLSSLNESVAKSHGKDGWDVKSEKVKVVTLNKIFEEYVKGKEIHFLKVDVEGLEDRVLIGNDWQKNRPWIVLVEATMPMSQIESYGHWEPILIEAGYLFVYADGLNRFYIAQEHGELIKAFKYPPNVFDEFVLNNHAQSVYRADQAEHKYALLEDSYINLRSDDEKTKLKVAKIEEELHNIYVSRSWRVTAPLRAFFQELRKFKKNSRENLFYFAGGGMRYLSRNKYLKKAILLLVERFPTIKHRLQSLMAKSSVVSNLPIRSYGKEEDFQDFIDPKVAVVKAKSLELRDACLQQEEVEGNVTLLTIDGHFSGSYSLAAVNRNIVMRLKDCSFANMKILISPREVEKVNWVRDTPGGSRETKLLSELIVNNETGSNSSNENICLYHHYPLVENIDHTVGLPIALFFWEESRIPESMVNTLNSNYVGVVVTAWFVKKALMDSGCILPIQIVSIPLMAASPSSHSNEDLVTDIKKKAEVSLLHVSSCFPRKGVDVLLEAFNILASQFSQVRLIIKTFHNPHNKVIDWVECLVNEENRSRVKVIFEDYDSKMMAKLYADSDIVVLPTRGEGLNMPAIEAGEFLRPVVVTGYGAHTDFAESENSWWIPYRFARAQSHFSSSQSVWVEPSAEALKIRLEELCQKLLDGNEIVNAKTKRLKEKVEKQFFSNSSTHSFLSAILRFRKYSYSSEINKKSISISMVTTWAEACGIAEYSQQIASNLSDFECNVNVLAPKGRVDKKSFNGFDHIQCDEVWTMGCSPDLSNCFTEDIVWLQHHFAFYNLDEGLLRSLKKLRDKDKLIYITLHTTRVVLDFNKSVQESIALCMTYFDRVFVHTLDDLNNLKRIGVVDNVTLMPQGIKESKLIEFSNLKANGKSNFFTIGCFGFLLEHKGVYQLITAFNDFIKGKSDPQNYRLRLINSIRDSSESFKEFERCDQLIKKYKIQNLVEWHTKYQSIEEIETLLGECNLLVLPYQYTQESSSAAVRTAIACCKTVATTPAPIFEEVDNITFKIDGFSSNDIKNLLIQADMGFDKKMEEEVYENRCKWIKEHNWGNVAKSYIQLFNSVSVDAAFLDEFN